MHVSKKYRNLQTFYRYYCGEVVRNVFYWEYLNKKTLFLIAVLIVCFFSMQQVLFAFCSPLIDYSLQLDTHRSDALMS